MFIDSTYRVNIEHYVLYAIVVMDEHGFGIAHAAAEGAADEELIDLDLDDAPVPTKEYNDLGSRWNAGNTLAKEIASVKARFGAIEFVPRLQALQHFLDI